MLSDEQMAELKVLVIAGPVPERHGVARWRCVDLCREIAARWPVTVCEQTVGRWLRQFGLTRLQPRPYHPKKDPAARAIAVHKSEHCEEAHEAGVIPCGAFALPAQ